MKQCGHFSHIVIVFLLAMFSVCFLGCSVDNPTEEKLNVSVSILPQEEWVKAIGGDKVNVTVMIPPGSSPHSYEPTFSQMKALANSKIYAAVGSGIECEISFLDKLLDINPNLLLVDCSEGIELMEMGEQEHNGEHSSDGVHSFDPHIWMSLVNAPVMVTNIYNGLVAVDPANEGYYQQNLNVYLEELEEMHRSFQEGFATLSNRVFIIQHPSLGYFARDYNLIQIAAEESGNDATMQSMVHTIEQARENNIKILFVSPQFSPNVADTVAREINGTVETLDTLAKDYKDNMTRIYNAMLSAMGGN
jgi:zinc transport system substrate-binding protein